MFRQRLFYKAGQQRVAPYLMHVLNKARKRGVAYTLYIYVCVYVYVHTSDGKVKNGWHESSPETRKYIHTYVRPYTRYRIQRLYPLSVCF